ncbi:hypothetical protein M409DRAFT_26908 [Zasmidium cellare ATCC 36951]|uniref:MT-A70-domain-containing protein n=1 Tax=Zasmidium cellare ATCC 36951 TaxID=1080233 RepID=A0A6A6C8V9_ZASCE|nr:uncharacterized protein M409DRAFT_26908 [Zasmidium cellare ATCC 36951]KAF2162670.1 hypothetical protein M409DRAFT_26908 [Zasmidium cellare ATCC 36951]
MAGTGSPILWQDEKRSITLLDIPRSVSAAQGTAERPCYDLLLSSEPLEKPFVVVEPKSNKAKQNLQQNTVDEELHTAYRDILDNALQSIRQHHQGPWALKRPFIAGQSIVRPGKKRKLDSQDITRDVHSVAETEDALPENGLLDRIAQSDFTNQDPAEREPEEEACQICDSDDPNFQTNCSPSPLLKSHQPPNCSSDQQTANPIRIAPFSSFHLSDCTTHSRAFHTSIRHQANSHETRRHFDFILLDPPWPNRSVKRTYQTPGAGYAISNSLDDVYDLLLKMDLDMLMAEDCLVGMWITNKQAIRELVLGEDGVFDQWGVELVEEWIWLKTTVYGETVTPVESAWRKPYEILLLGRKQRRGGAASGDVTDVKRRCIVAVPDLHSRKPCLKELIEPLMPDPKDYRALEVFARHLVAGWWSWGNKCTKFNTESNWRRADDFKDTNADQKAVDRAP